MFIDTLDRSTAFIKLCVVIVKYALIFVTIASVTSSIQ